MPLECILPAESLELHRLRYRRALALKAIALATLGHAAWLLLI